MSTEYLPLILDRSSGTPTTGNIRRPAIANIPDVAQALLDWMPAQSLLVRLNGVPTSLVCPPSRVIGATGTGGLRPLTAGDLDSFLGLSQLIAGRAPVGHSHTILEISGLSFALQNLARLVHLHTPGDIVVPPGTPTGYGLRVEGGVLVFGPVGGSGGGGIANPLDVPLDLGGYSILCGGLDVLHCAGGRVILGGARVPYLDEGTPATGHVWIYEGGTWVHRPMTQADVIGTTVPGLAGTRLSDQLADVVTQLGGLAVTGHTHELADIAVPSGAVPGYYVTPASGGGWAILPLPAAGGGIANPLTADLDIATYKVKSDTTELLRYAGGQILIGGRAIFPSTIATPAAGHVPIYDAGNEDFRNGFLAAGYVSTSAITGVTGTDVQAMLASLKDLVDDATLATTDDLDEGATNKYTTTTSVATAGALMATSRSDDAALGTSTTLVPSQRAVKVYVDTAIAMVGVGFGTAAIFPGSPVDGDLFHRSDLRETFQYVAAESAWIGLTARSITQYLGDLPTLEGADTGSYLYGNGNTAGFRLPFDVYLTGVTFQSTIIDTGDIIVRKAPESGSITDALTLEISSARGGVLSDQLVAASQYDLISIFATGYTTGVDYATVSVSYVRRIAA